MKGWKSVVLMLLACLFLWLAGYEYNKLDKHPITTPSPTHTTSHR